MSYFDNEPDPGHDDWSRELDEEDEEDVDDPLYGVGHDDE